MWRDSSTTSEFLGRDEPPCRTYKISIPTHSLPASIPGKKPRTRSFASAPQTVQRASGQLVAGVEFQSSFEMSHSFLRLPLLEEHGPHVVVLVYEVGLDPQPASGIQVPTTACTGDFPQIRSPVHFAQLRMSK